MKSPRYYARTASLAFGKRIYFRDGLNTGYDRPSRASAAQFGTDAILY